MRRIGGAVVAALLAAGGAAPASAAITVAPPLDVPFLSNHYFQSVAVLEDGSFALSGATLYPIPDEDGHTQFEVQAYAPDGSPIGVKYSPQPAFPSDTGGIGSLGDRYFVSWQHYAAKGSRATFLSREGVVLAPPFSWPNSEMPSYQLYYRYGPGPRWRFLPIVFHFKGGDQLENLQPSVQVHGPDAQPLGPPIALASHASRTYEIDMAMNGDGRFVVVYQRCPKSFPVRPCLTGLQVFDGSGQAQTEFLTHGVKQDSLVAGIAPAGQILLFWSSGTDPKAALFFAGLFDKDGSPITRSLLVRRVPLPGGFIQQVHALSGGSFLLSWIEINQDGTTSFFLSEFDPATRRVSPPTMVATDQLAADGYRFEITGSGKGVVAWTSFAGDVFTGHARLITAHEATAAAR